MISLDCAHNTQMPMTVMRNFVFLRLKAGLKWLSETFELAYIFAWEQFSFFTLRNQNQTADTNTNFFLVTRLTTLLLLQSGFSSEDEPITKNNVMWIQRNEFFSNFYLFLEYFSLFRVLKAFRNVHKSGQLSSSHEERLCDDWKTIDTAVDWLIHAFMLTVAVWSCEREQRFYKCLFTLLHWWVLFTHSCVHCDKITSRTTK